MPDNSTLQSSLQLLISRLRPSERPALIQKYSDEPLGMVLLTCSNPHNSRIEKEDVVERISALQRRRTNSEITLLMKCKHNSDGFWQAVQEAAKAVPTEGESLAFLLSGAAPDRRLYHQLLHFPLPKLFLNDRVLAYRDWLRTCLFRFKCETKIRDAVMQRLELMDRQWLIDTLPDLHVADHPEIAFRTLCRLTDEPERIFKIADQCTSYPKIERFAGEIVSFIQPQTMIDKIFSEWFYKVQQKIPDSLAIQAFLLKHIESADLMAEILTTSRFLDEGGLFFWFDGRFNKSDLAHKLSGQSSFYCRYLAKTLFEKADPVRYAQSIEDLKVSFKYSFVEAL
eukprot:Protomagalhaensia_sp_Gyna_25__5286@NODE_656_length_2901_cov_6_734102_g512_i0_p2_GENE_NODE_656_length_2901_cov_6_734102_g512_i0NODE_656_length_2901_cov_6_734102_g512_i0_p2_ORF_typecomplete_len340_score32_71_NODE_656_length_2901_cov_6_734102_g512_i015772596